MGVGAWRAYGLAIMNTGKAIENRMGLVAWAMLSLSLFLMDAPVSRLADLYASQFRLQGLGLVESLALLGIGATLGLGGSWIAVKRHIRDIEPA